MNELPVKLPAALDVCCRRCMLKLGGSWMRCDIIRVEIKFGAQQIIFLWKSFLCNLE